MRELVEDLGHFIPAFPTSDVHHYLSVGPLCELLLCDGLSRSERTWDSCSTTLGEGEEEVQYSLSCHEGYVRCVLLYEWSRVPYWPLLHHRYFRPIFQLAYRLGDIERTGLNGFHDSLLSRRYHDSVFNSLSFLDRTYHMSCR